MLLFASHHRGSRRRRRGLFGWLWSIVTWPFRAVDRAEKAVVKAYKKRRDRFRHKYRHSKIVAPLVGTIVWLILAPLRLVWFVVTAPFRLVSGTFTQIETVRRKRVWMHLLQGVPAALAVIGVFSVLMMLTLQGNDLPQTYRQAAQKEYDNGNFARAQLYLQRVLQLGADTKQTSFLLARTLEKTGQPNRSAAILDSLAPDNKPGYPEAHLWKAAFLIENPETFESEERLRNLHRHLQIAEEALSGDPDLDYYLGRFYLAIAGPDDKNLRLKAFDHLKHASRTRPELNFDLYALSKFLGRTEDATETLALATAHFEQKLAKKSGDDEARMRLVQLMVDTGDYERMFHLLQEGISLDPDGPMKEALALGHVHRYVSQTPQERRNPSFGLSLLAKALEIDPQCKPALNALLQFGEGQDASTAAIAAAHDMLESLIAVGESAPLAHFALGVKAWQEEDTGNAVWHLERAYHLDPKMANLANNLAWVLAFEGDNPDPQRALGLINSVLEAHPEVPAYIETRGQILVKLERWAEALDDLERALPTYQRNIRLHESLAKVYENLGQTGLAGKHTTVAANLRAQEAGE